MIKYPIGIQTFEQIVINNYVYIDKTQLLYTLINSSKTAFLSRPRRFGKSLIVTTLEQIFLGKRELFKGLAICDTDYDFIEYPVIKLSFINDDYQDADNLRLAINSMLDDVAFKYDVKLSAPTHNLRLKELVLALFRQTNRPVVILIDEYDKPILNHLFSEHLSEIKKVISGFYGAIKSLDEYLQFVFVTGVSKFAKVSVFSGMNSLVDISMEREYSALCGITHDEIDNYFTEPLHQIAASLGMEYSILRAKLASWYNGYLFHPKGEGVYSPFSLLSLLRKKEFGHYWFATATPTFVIDMIKENQFDLAQIQEYELDDSALMACEPEHIDVLPLLLQTGYLTIDTFDDGFYQLAFPNFEVEYAFNRAIVNQFSSITPHTHSGYIRKLCNALNNNEITEFFTILKVFFVNIPYDITLKQEKYYQSLFFSIFTLIGYDIDCEVRTNIGRIDCVLTTNTHVYIIEFKLDGTKEQALAQINDKQYSQKYQLNNRILCLVGADFDSKTRNLNDFVISKM